MTAWTLQSLRSRSDELHRIAARWGASRLRVFGSVARGDASATSDVDLLVQFDADRSLLDHGGLLMDLEQMLDCHVDLVDEDALRSRFRAHVMEAAVPI